MQRLTIPGHSTVGAQGDHKAPSDRFDGRNRRIEIVTLTPFKCLGFITEHQLYTALYHGGHVVAEELHHARV